MEDKYLRARAEIANMANRGKMSVSNYKIPFTDLAKITSIN